MIPIAVLVALALVTLLLLGLVAPGCSGTDENGATTTTVASTATTAQTGSSGSTTTTAQTGSSNPERLIVGGKTAEEYAAALPELEKAAAAKPTDLAALQELAIAQYNTGKYEQAATTYQKMLQLKDDALTHNNYANVLRDWKKLDEAKAEYEKAISGDAKLITAYVNLVAVLEAQGNISGAIEVLDRGLQVMTGSDKTRLETYKAKLSGTSTTT
jgi:tetratricopeptide (TPR) repeat protein